jgi:RND family efflux transporter MFP subunit
MSKALLFVAIGLGLLAGAGLGLVSRGSAHDMAEPTLAAAPRNDWVAANGKTEGVREELPLKPEITGTIRAVHVKTNQDVRKGDLLVELENGTHQAQVRRAEADSCSKEAEFERARDAYERARNSRTGVSPMDLKQAEAALHKARADWDVARADLMRARAELARTHLLAPWDGRVLRVFNEPGALVGPNGTPILLLADVSRRRVRAFVEELDALRVQKGQAAVVTVDGAPGKEFAGHVSEVLLRMDRDATRSDKPGELADVYHRPVVIDLDDGHELPLNQRVDVRIQIPVSPR